MPGLVQRKQKRDETLERFLPTGLSFDRSTKQRQPMISPEVEARLCPYIGYKCKELGYHLLAIGGLKDHLHVLRSLSPTHVIAEVAKTLKGASSHYINKESGLNVAFYWQDGYGVVTLRLSEIPKVVKYINNQKEHHPKGNLSELLERR